MYKRQVYNCGGYERLETVKALAPYVDIWLPDFKYFDNRLAAKYSKAPDYFETAAAAIGQMIAQTGPPVYDSPLDVYKRQVLTGPAPWRGRSPVPPCPSHPPGKQPPCRPDG